MFKTFNIVNLTPLILNETKKKFKNKGITYVEVDDTFRRMITNKYRKATKEFIHINYKNTNKAKILIIGDGGKKIRIVQKYNN